MLDPRQRFSSGAELYHRYRPSYPAELLDWLASSAALGPGARIADVGCGTGISTRLFAARGFDVTGVDPNEEMLAFARREGEARYARGESTASGLPGASFDLVSAAQAFHWFDLAPTLAEFGRILKPQGWCAAFWNLRGSSPWLEAYDALLRAASREYGVLLKPLETIAALKARPEVVDAREAEFPNRQRLDRDGLFGRAWSSSYVQHGLADRQAFDRALAELFERHQAQGALDFPYRTVALAFRLAA